MAAALAEETTIEMPRRTRGDRSCNFVIRWVQNSGNLNNTIAISGVPKLQITQLSRIALKQEPFLL